MSQRAREAVQEALRARTEAKDRVATRLMGGRKDFVARARQMVEVAKATVQQEMASPESVRDLCETINFGASKSIMDRTCIRLKAEILKLVGEERTLVVEFIHSMGAKSEDELRRMVETVKSAEGVDDLTVIERCCTALEAYLPLHEGHRAMIIRRLGGYLPTDMGVANAADAGGAEEAS